MAASKSKRWVTVHSCPTFPMELSKMITTVGWKKWTQYFRYVMSKNCQFVHKKSCATEQLQSRVKPSLRSINTDRIVRDEVFFTVMSPIVNSFNIMCLGSLIAKMSNETFHNQFACNGRRCCTGKTPCQLITCALKSPRGEGRQKTKSFKLKETQISFNSILLGSKAIKKNYLTG